MGCEGSTRIAQRPYKRPETVSSVRLHRAEDRASVGPSLEAETWLRGLLVPGLRWRGIVTWSAIPFWEVVNNCR